jgi:hypothetical protein
MPQRKGKLLGFFIAEFPTLKGGRNSCGLQPTFIGETSPIGRTTEDELLSPIQDFSSQLRDAHDFGRPRLRTESI